MAAACLTSSVQRKVPRFTPGSRSPAGRLLMSPSISSTTTRQVQHTLRPLTHMVENVLGYLLGYEAGDFGKKELALWLLHVQNRCSTGLFLSMETGCT